MRHKGVEITTEKIESIILYWRTEKSNTAKEIAGVFGLSFVVIDDIIDEYLKELVIKTNSQII